MSSSQDPSVFSADRFTPRGQCGEWVAWEASLYAVSHVAITCAYIAIPAILFLAVRQSKKRQPSTLPALHPREHNIIRTTFALFILTCGLGHLEGLLAFRWPAYHLFALWHGFTALVSWAAVVVIFHYRAEILQEL